MVTLLFGSPVPTYHAPSDQTTDLAPGCPGCSWPSAATPRDALRIGSPAHRRWPTTSRRHRPPRELLSKRISPPRGLTAVALTNGLVAWTMLVGAISSEVFQQLGPDSIADPEAFFSYQVAMTRALLFERG